MRVHRLITVAAAALALAAGPALAQSEKAKKQGEVNKAAQTALDKFYKANPKLKEEVEKAPGYAVFTTYGMSFLIGGQGGKGVVHDNKTKRVTYMDMAQASAGFQAGFAETETLIVFRTEKGMEQFVNKGWDAGGGGAVQAGAAGKSVGAQTGQTAITDASTYSLTKNGLQVGVALTGAKVWKDKELN